MAESYAHAIANQHDKAQRSDISASLYGISSNNGLMQDLRDAYSATKEEYVKVWLSENRPYWLGNVTVRYDLQIQMWQQRGKKFEEAIHAFDGNQDLPSPESLGMPPMK
jgi:hypothetical protein